MAAKKRFRSKLVDQWTTDDVSCWLRSRCEGLVLEDEDREALTKVLNIVKRMELTGIDLSRQKFQFPISSDFLNLAIQRDLSDLKSSMDFFGLHAFIFNDLFAFAPLLVIYFPAPSQAIWGLRS